MDLPVIAFFGEAGEIFKGFVGTVLQNKQSFRDEPVFPDYHGRQFDYMRMIIRRIRKNKGEGMYFFFQEFESIGFNEADRIDIQKFKVFPDGSAMKPVALNTCNILATQ
jgi:hypothetical protein